ncbi:MAG: amidohydrolase, partial [Kordiimonas sp.]
MRILFLLLISMALAACDDNMPTSVANQPVSETADQPILIFGGTILTMDTELPTVPAMVIEDGKIAAVGTQTILTPEYPNAQLYNLDGRTIIPGIIDSHVHVYQLGAESIKANLVGTNTVAEMVSRLQTFYPNPAPGEWLVGQGWDEGAWASIGYPDRAELDAAFPDNPVLLQSLHGFPGFYNGAALKAAGVDKTTNDPDVGQILRRENGEPTGVFLTLARNLIERHAPPPTLTQVKSAILAGLRQLSKAGITTIHEAGMTPVIMEAFRTLADEGILPVRVYGLLDGNDHALMNRMFKAGPIIDSEGFFSVRGIKVFYDGSLGSRTALLHAPYSDKSEEAHPTERISIGGVFSLAEQAAKHGFQMAVHTIGDEGNDRILNVYRSALAHFPPQDHRWRLEHAQVVLPNYYEQ